MLRTLACWTSWLLNISCPSDTLHSLSCLDRDWLSYFNHIVLLLLSQSDILVRILSSPQCTRPPLSFSLSCFLPDGCVSGKVLATNLRRAPRSCKSCVTVNLVIISRQILVHVWLWFSCSLILSLPSDRLPWIALSKRGKSVERWDSWQHSYKSSNSIKMSSFVRRSSLTHSIAKLKKEDNRCSATRCDRPVSLMTLS